MSRRRNIGKYISLEASEDESEIESEDVDDVVDYKPNYTDIAKQVERKYVFQDEELDEEEVEEGEEGLMQSQLLPRNNSPRLFLVRVKRGAEKEIALRILGNKPNVCSIVVKDGLRGYLYIEAFQKQQVIDSFGKVRGINKSKISIVPQDEMIDALTYRTDFKAVEFGRIKKGKYKGDLASIISSEGEMVTIRVVPRLNGIKRLFNPEEYKGEAIRKEKNVFEYRRDFYVNGFLEKEVLRSTIDFEAEPNFEELEQFHVRKSFEVGDRVRVVKGELVGVEGIVKNVTGNSITLQKDSKTFEVLGEACEKYYNVGEEVCLGEENGIITNYSSGVYYVAIKEFTEEVRVTVDKLSKPIPFTKEVVRKERPKQIFRRDGLVNRQVQIRKGKYKGHTGTVKDVYMNKCRIQINSNLSFITIPREDVAEVEEIHPTANDYIKKDKYTNDYTNNYTNDYMKTDYMKTDSYMKTDYMKTPRHLDSTSIYSGALIKASGTVVLVEDFVGNTFFTERGTFDRNEVDFVHPARNEEVIVMDGDCRGSRGVVLNVQDDLCIVKMKDGLIKNLPIATLTKLEQ